MTEEEQRKANQLTACYFRIALLSALINEEAAFFLPECGNSGIKASLKRMKDCFTNNVAAIESHLQPESLKLLRQQIDGSSEKKAAIGKILEKLAMLEEQQVLDIETDFDTQIKIKY